MASDNSEEKNTEIWSTRIQKELLALTTDNVTEEAKKEMTDVLPAFCSVKEHNLDIGAGNCTVTCVLDLPATERPTETATETAIAITFDVSLQKKADGSVDPSGVSYPFQKPMAIVTSGSSRFPEGSTAKDGDCIDIEMDWTPTLHLSDAILNVALKVKECLSQGEPLYAAELVVAKDNEGKRTTGLGATVGATIRNLTKPAAAGGAAAAADKKKGGRWGRKGRVRMARPKATAKEVRIGDEINMLEAPWVDCQGVYSCKAIRRPKFAEEAIQAAESKQNAVGVGEKQQVRRSIVNVMDENSDQGPVPEAFGDYMRQSAVGVSQAASAGFAGAGAMLRNFTNSTRGLLEESFLMITESHIIELRSNKLNLSTGTVTFAIPIEMMAKLKFRRQESVSLFFKPAPDDPLIYMCPDSADCVHQIQAVLKRHGVKGKHTNAATHRAINQALHLVQEIQTKELALKHDPSIERVNEIMDLYRQAAERFEVAGDVRHEEVVTHMRKFLALPLTVSVLDGSYKKPEHATDDKPIAIEKSEPSILDKKFEDNMDDLLAEAESDLKEMKGNAADVELEGMYDDEGDDGIASTENTIAEFENMLKEADEELAALMNS